MFRISKVISLSSENCQWLHEQLEILPLNSYPFRLEQLPLNGIYFFYENGEIWGHGGSKSRIVRVGTHRDGNFRSRIGEHYLLNESKMNFSVDSSGPRDRSIFRRNLGRAIIQRHNLGYLNTWNICFTSRENRIKFRDKRDMKIEKAVESEVTRLMRANFSFRFIILDDQDQRMGKKGLESSIIGTLAQCDLCEPSPTWLGLKSPKPKICASGLWLVQHLSSPGISESEKIVITDAIEKTRKWIVSEKPEDI